MKIALPSSGNSIDDHFGHCEYFTILTMDENKNIVSEEKLQSPQSCGCKSGIVHTLAEKGVTLMLAGNIGGGAINVLQSRGIEVVRGCSGDIKAVTQQWLSGSLSDSGLTCHAHEHSDACSH
ncbi:MAG TPA: NifB/NifX family molybdenum-iron cluster-binding protein [Bacteroidota bacterium]|nr:NifB/NifX family molybdenum-iron cluster-binding protein [Bacteroidota bacterium]